MAYDTTPFIDAVQESTSLKNIPNRDPLRREKTGEFVFEEFFDREAFRDSKSGSVTESDIDETVEEVFEPLINLADEIEAVSIERRTQEDDKNWIFVLVEIPENENEQADLGRKVGQSIKKRRML